MSLTRVLILAVISFFLWSATALSSTPAGEGDTLTLDEAIQSALGNNPEMQEARKEAEAAKARILQAEALSPAELTLQWNAVPSAFALSEAEERSLGLVQAFEFPGKRRARGRVARREAEIAGEKLRQTQLRLAAEVKRAYFKAVLQQKLASNTEFARELLQQFQAMAIVRYQAQKAPFLEVLRTKVELAKANNQLLETQRDLQNSLAQLNRLLGRPGAAPLSLSGDLSFHPYERSLEELLAERRGDRPAEKIAEALVQRGRAAASLANKSYLPDLSLGFTHQSVKEPAPLSGLPLTNTGATTKWAWELGLTVPWYFWKRPKGEVAEAQANLTAARIHREAVQRNITTAIEKAYREAKTAEAQVKTFEESLLGDLDDELQAAIALYRMDQIDALNLIDTYRTYTETKSEHHRALYNYRVAVADLEVAGEETSDP